jgi:hypothetical protein
MVRLSASSGASWKAWFRTNLRRDVRAMGPLTSTILIVVITLGLAVVLYLMVTH